MSNDNRPYDWQTEDEWLTPDDCDHEDYDVNVEGRATCLICNHRWWPSAKELDQYYGAMQGEEKCPRWKPA